MGIIRFFRRDGISPLLFIGRTPYTSRRFQGEENLDFYAGET